ncbi:MAG: Fpg/Nei family DNA glycosylase [Mycobacterium sp.]|nr:Fpg/Nei family DNA glycosylase [Mycobacterium sp.]
MPEGHTLHRLARLHQRRFAGSPVRVSSPQGRFTDAAVLDGLVLAKASAWGKHLFHHYAPDRIVHIHLGLYGTFREHRTPMPEPRGQVRMRIVGADYGTDLRGPTACEVIDEAQFAAIQSRLGPDPLRGDADPTAAWERIAKSRKAIGALLMDQSVLAGVGNVYRSELLFRHGIDPYRPGRDIDRQEFDAAWTDLVELMKLGVRRGRIIVIRPEHDHGAAAYGPGRPRTYVYRRAGDPCRLCGTAVRTAEMEGRNLFWCPACQV